MANNFPAVPTAYLLAGIKYAVQFPTVTPVSPFTGVTVSMGGGLLNLGGQGSVAWQFSTPGTFGSFDQTTAESVIAKVVTDVCQLIADLTGQSLTQVQGQVSIARHWLWTDSAGDSASYTDTMTYP